MRKLGFSNQWIQWTITLHEEVETLVVVNGQKGKSFQMERPICQRCPITLYIYLFVVDVLGYKISNTKYKIERLTLPNGIQIWDHKFADDAIMFLKRNPNNLQKTLQVLQTFCEASRGKVNWHKSNAIWVSKKNKKRSWGENKRLF
jgi:hypothetical protein